MFYKLSNTASLNEIEDEFNAKFEFPNLYRPTSVINGLEESTLAIITAKNPDQIRFGIWGMLPQSLKENWKIFQNLTNTLNINADHLDLNDSLYMEALERRRCIVITTGFFTSGLYKGKIYPHHVYLTDHQPFGIAGVYNKLKDGFLTFSILIKKTHNELGEIPNILHYKPLIFDDRDRKHWLNQKFEFDNLKDLIRSHQVLEYHSHPVSKEFYDNDILYDQIIKSKAFKEFLALS